MQIALLLLCAVDLGFFTYYMIAYDIGGRNTISDSLFTKPEYAVVLSCTLAARLLGVVLYFFRYRTASCAWIVPGCIGVSLALFGWVWLVVHKDNMEHFTGVFVFCLGSFVYSIVLLRLCEESHPHLSQLHFGLEVFLFLASGVLVLLFVIVWFNEEMNDKHKTKTYTSTAITYEDPNQYAYIIEHCAYITFLLFYAGFFLFHTPDWKRKPFVDGVYSGEREAVEMNALKPLVPVAIVNA